MASRSLNAALWLLAFLLPVKFGGLVILPDRPETFADWWLGRWPVELAIACALLWAALALFCRRRRKEADAQAGVIPPPYVGAYGLITAAVLLWLAAQWLGAAFSPWPSRAVSVAIFFTATAAFFWIGGAKDADERYQLILGALTAATVVVCGVALHQHFVAFPQTLRDASTAAGTLPPEVRERLPDLVAKLRQGRVFGTLFYPNALAGYLILVGPPACCWLWLYLRQRLMRRVSVAAAVALAGVMLWCVLLTKSKGGFLMLALALAAGLMFCRPIPARWRVGVLAALVALGAIYFGAAGLRRGLETIEARGDYWRAGLAMIAEQPWLGGGPGTFGFRYVKYRPADAEWTRLVHNNYLQQWTDAGLIGFASFAAFWVAVLWLGAPRSRRRKEADGSSGGAARSASSRRRLRETEFDRLACRNSVTPVTELRLPAETDFDWLRWATWTGLTAWALHNLVDFDLYIAAIAWPAFLMAGWMARRGV
ncbi:MAG: O-antigen ligase family protein [Verrucomicrobia bacterium]|nr:O-antigen ligase family protein [Verrucomicrobiota bacterium]